MQYDGSRFTIANYANGQVELNYDPKYGYQIDSRYVSFLFSLSFLIIYLIIKPRYPIASLSTPSSANAYRKWTITPVCIFILVRKFMFLLILLVTKQIAVDSDTFVIYTANRNVLSADYTVFDRYTQYY